ncbi:MAG: HAMP domain-containing protein, partial [Candidatus Riflebacteria bacterium]|nr:HAMP domain-containing protein [Candidatus Riflebacteria bacterium]
MNIRQQLFRMNLLSIGVAFGLILLILVIKDVRNYKDYVLQNLSGQAKIIGNFSSTALTFSDEKTAAEILATLGAFPDIVQSAIYTREGKMFARYVRGAEAYDESIAPKEHGISIGLLAISLHDSIRQGNEVKGSISITYDIAPFLKQFGSEAILLAFISASGMFIASLLFSRFQRAISGPIHELTDTMQTISHEKNYSLRVPVTGKGEVHILAEKFNELLSITEDWGREIMTHRQNLEHLVDKRTLELQ